MILFVRWNGTASGGFPPGSKPAGSQVILLEQRKNIFNETKKWVEPIGSLVVEERQQRVSSSPVVKVNESFFHRHELCTAARALSVVQSDAIEESRHETMNVLAIMRQVLDGMPQNHMEKGFQVIWDTRSRRRSTRCSCRHELPRPLG